MTLTNPIQGGEARDFTCAICLRNVPMWWNSRGRGCQMAPVCLYCEGQYTRGIGKPTGGSFRDRREANRILALAEALSAEAHSQVWRARYV